MQLFILLNFTFRQSFFTVSRRKVTDENFLVKLNTLLAFTYLFANKSIGMYLRNGIFDIKCVFFANGTFI